MNMFLISLSKRKKMFIAAFHKDFLYSDCAEKTLQISISFYLSKSDVILSKSEVIYCDMY